MQVKQLPQVQGQKRLAVIFGTGEEMTRGLADLAKTRSIPGAYFTGIGALRAAMLGFFHVRPTLEVILIETPAALRRRFDPATGLALLDLSDPPR